MRMSKERGVEHLIEALGDWSSKHPPTIRELADYMELSTGRVHQLACLAKDQGRIVWEPHRPRTIALKEGKR